MGPEEKQTRVMSRAALVAALRPESSRFTELVESGAERLDWPWLLERAASHKVSALLAARVEQGGLTARVGERVAARLQKTRAEARGRAATALLTLRDLDAAFARESIPFLVVKGSVLAEHVYGDRAARRFFDVDIVVPPPAVEAAEGLLHSLGYRLGHTQKLLAAAPNGAGEMRLAERLTHEFYRRFEYEIPFVPPPNAPRLAVDLHWHIASRSRVTVSAADLWRETVSVAVNDTHVTTLSPPATLIHLAVHATTCPFAGFRLLHLCDVAWAATRFAEHADDMWDLAEAWGAAAHLRDVFELTERALDVVLPASSRRRRWRPRSPMIAPVFSIVADAAFLVGRAGTSQRRRAWTETVWSLAMGCLSHNLRRSLRVRLSRLRWHWQRWRVRAPA
jgi:Uncharacterised nucleotidyltransferase